MTTARSWGSEGPAAETARRAPSQRAAPVHRRASRSDARRARRRRLQCEQVLIALIMLAALVATVVLLAHRSQSQPVGPPASLQAVSVLLVGGSQ